MSFFYPNHDLFSHLICQLCHFPGDTIRFFSDTVFSTWREKNMAKVKWNVLGCFVRGNCLIELIWGSYWIRNRDHLRRIGAWMRQMCCSPHGHSYINDRSCDWWIWKEGFVASFEETNFKKKIGYLEIVHFEYLWLVDEKGKFRRVIWRNRVIKKIRKKKHTWKLCILNDDLCMRYVKFGNYNVMLFDY